MEYFKIMRFTSVYLIILNYYFNLPLGFATVHIALQTYIIFFILLVFYKYLSLEIPCIPFMTLKYYIKRLKTQGRS